jgi:lysozyme
VKTSDKGINLIKNFEGCRFKAYKCPAGVWTIGYGHTNNVRQDDVITQQEADELLKRDLVRFEDAVNSLVKVPLNQNQFDALVSFCYNVGYGDKGFGGSTMLKLINAKDFKGAAEQFARWNKAGATVLAGLVKRRKAEADLFSSDADIVSVVKTLTIQKLSNGKCNLLVDGKLKFKENTFATLLYHLANT